VEVTKKAEAAGFAFKEIALPLQSTTEEVVQAVRDAHELPHIAGIIVQLPLPEHIDREQVTEAIDPKFDVDCLTKQNAKAFYDNEDSFAFPTALACMELLNSLDLDLSVKKVVIIGEGELVGSPLKALLKRKNIIAESINSTTVDKDVIIKNADIVISAIGVPQYLKADMIQEGAIVIDAGTAESNGGIVGDVDFESMKDKVSAIAKVPGGVGPVTVAMLLQNVRDAFIKNSHV
jgi:methylenetetrahydrofolate dehydrogenase (NADP+)/methenyltetrahydrofolate cyclohydrolase